MKIFVQLKKCWLVLPSQRFACYQQQRLSYGI